jgi:hypothetical protein
MDLGQGEMPERESQVVAQPAFQPLDLPKGLARVRAFIVAVLDEKATPRPAANVI